MARKKFDKFSNICEEKPWFMWIQCKICKDEFRREPIFTFYPKNPQWPSMSFCKNCLPTKQDVYDYVNKPPIPPGQRNLPPAPPRGNHPKNP